MATPPLPPNPSIDNPPLTPEPIREDPEPDNPEKPKDDPVNPDPRPKKVRGQREQSGLSVETLFCLPPF